MTTSTSVKSAEMAVYSHAEPPPYEPRREGSPLTESSKNFIKTLPIASVPVQQDHEAAEPTKKRHNVRFYICLVSGIILLILLGLGVLAYICYPEIPQMKEINGDLTNGFSLTIHSDNWYDITISRVYAQANHLGRPVATCEVGPFIIKANQDTVVPFSVRPVFPIPQSAIQACKNSPVLHLDIEVEIHPKLIAWTGQHLTYHIRKSLPCPANAQLMPSHRAKSLSKKKTPANRQEIKEIAERHGVTLEEVEEFCKEMDYDVDDLEELAKQHGFNSLKEASDELLKHGLTPQDVRQYFKDND